MKLLIRRNQDEKKGFFGGSKGMSFALSCRIELNSEEVALIEKYKQWDYPVYQYETAKGGAATWSVRELKDGRSVSCDGVGELLDGEEHIKGACQNLKAMLSVMASFGGEESYEF